MSRNTPNDDELTFTVASVWREERVSCPHRDILGAYLSGGLEDGARDFIRFHLEQSQCPYCNAVVDDLRTTERDAAASGLKELHDRVLRSTVTMLRDASRRR